MEKTTKLWRPVGKPELDLIQASDWKRFPKRLPSQPIFYPVCSPGYAVSVTAWNQPGYVLEFAVKSDYISQFEKHVVGSRKHEEYWIPAEGLEEFNDNIVGTISILMVYGNCDSSVV